MENAQREAERVGKLFSTKHRPGFANKNEFHAWWMKQNDLQDGKCFYCCTPLNLIQQLIGDKKLAVRKIGWGVRGKCFELDRKDSAKPYEPDNCVLACYYCNNDKSYIYDWQQYKKFFGPNRRLHFEALAAGEAVA